MQTSFYTYFHTRNDTGAVFYVGKGQDKTRRAYDMRRNPHWNNIVAKCGHTVHIGSYWPTEVEAFEHEKFLILCFKDMGIPLTNMTDGGEGVSGYVQSIEQRTHHSKVLTGHKMSDATRAALSIANTGRVYTKEQREAMSLRMIGRPAHNKGKPMSEEQKSKHSEWMMGNTHTKGKTIPAISAALVGRKKSQAHRAAISAVNIGKKQTSEHIAKAAATRIGKKRSAETKALMKAAWIKRKARQITQPETQVSLTKGALA